MSGDFRGCVGEGLEVVYLSIHSAYDNGDKVSFGRGNWFFAYYDEFKPLMDGWITTSRENLTSTACHWLIPVPVRM